MAIRESKAAERLYGCLLLLYPRDFRLRFGSDMSQLFRDIVSQEAHGERFGGYLALWISTLRDLGRSLLREWGEALLGAEENGSVVQNLTDSLVVPAWITMTVLVQGYFCAVLAQFLQTLMYSAHLSSSLGLRPADPVAVTVAATCSLGLASALAAWVIARNNRMQDPIIKLLSCQKASDARA